MAGDVRAFLRAGTVGITLLCFTACSTLQPIEDFSPAAIVQEVEPGDEVTVVVRAGTAYELTVTKVETDALTGRTRSGKTYRIEYEAIRHISVARGDAIRTVGAALVTVYVVISAVIVYAIASWGE